MAIFDALYGRFQAVLAVHTKQGELAALSHLSRPDAAAIQPLVFALPRFVPGSRVMAGFTATAATLAEYGRPMLVDLTKIPSDHPLRGGPLGAFDFLDGQVSDALDEKHGILADGLPTVIPVLPAADQQTDTDAVRRLDDRDGRGVAIRIGGPGLDRRPPQAWTSQLARTMSALKIPPDRIDVIVDAAYVDTVEDRRIDQICDLVSRIHQLMPARSVTLLAGSVPPKRFVSQTIIKPRYERLLWSACAGSLSGSLRYGDYGVVHPLQADRQLSGPVTTNPYLFYTAGNGSLYLSRHLPRDDNGKIVRGGGAGKFREISAELSRHADFAGPRYSWGDAELAGCAKGAVQNVGSVTRWIAIATSHHCAHLADHSHSSPLPAATPSYAA